MSSGNFKLRIVIAGAIAIYGGALPVEDICAQTSEASTKKPAARQPQKTPVAKTSAAAKPSSAPKTEPAKTTAAAADTPPAPKLSVPKPGPASAEGRYVAQVHALLAPLRDAAISPEDTQRLKEAIRLIGPDPAGAKAKRSEITDPVARKIAEWVAFKAGAGDPFEIQAFATANPSWPNRALVIRRAEEQLLAAGGNAQKIREFFKGREPETGAGYAALASAALAEGKEAEAKALASKVWRDFELAATFENGFIERFKPLLTEADHKRRLDRILVDEVRFSAARSERAAFAKRVIPLLSEPERKKAEARLAIFLRAKLAGKLLDALPKEEERADWGLAYQRIQHLRRSKQHQDAWKLLIAAPTDPDLITSPDDWWAERRSAAYDAIKAGQYETAYKLVRDAGPLTVNPLKEQTFLAGWIAFRHLGKPDAALKHFGASGAAADGPLSAARAEYWSGRVLETMNKGGEARKRYAAAAKISDTFHGQLAQQKLSTAGPTDLPSPLPALPTPDQAKQFNNLDSVRAAAIVSKAGLDVNLRRAIFGHLRNYLQSEAEMAMLAQLANDLDDPQTALRVGKTAIARGMNLIAYAYPLHAFPDYSPLRQPPETAMMLGIARQETEFNNHIVSTAGARGLLQVMPVTATHVCRDYRVKCDIARLNTDNAYNAQLASAYIADRMAEFRGSYVLTLAGYNAGPGRARQWISEFGDPREPGVDPIDWIERIPFEETREYVKKVLSNIQIYRARLGETAPLRLEQDLRRKSERTASRPVDQKTE